MRSTTFPRARRSGRRASGSPAAHALARAGLTARGVIYILIGWVAVLVALGHGAHEADQQGALQLLAGKPYGTVSLWLLGIGFAAYALWRLSETAYGVAGAGNGAGPRLKSLGRAAIYGGFAYLTFEVLSGRHGSQARQQQDVTAKVMGHPGGRWLVAGRHHRADHRPHRPGHDQRGSPPPVHEIPAYLADEPGDAPRRPDARHDRHHRPGLVVALVGILVIDAAVTHSPPKSRGIDKALLTLRNEPFGPVLLGLTALGLIVFGVYGLCEARWRRV